jgi:hypothetical protein
VLKTTIRFSQLSLARPTLESSFHDLSHSTRYVCISWVQRSKFDVVCLQKGAELIISSGCCASNDSYKKSLKLGALPLFPILTYKYVTKLDAIVFSTLRSETSHNAIRSLENSSVICNAVSTSIRYVISILNTLQQEPLTFHGHHKVLEHQL